MVGTFRQSGVGQVMVGLIVALIIGAFVLGGGAMSAAGLTKDCAIEVGNACVEPKEYYAAYGLMSSIGLNEKAAKQLQLRAQIAEGLVERELLRKEAERLGVSITEQALDEELAVGRTRVSLPAAHAERLALSLAMCVEGPAGCAPGTVGLRALPVLRNGVLDYDRYTRMVRVSTGRSPSQFKEQQKREHTAERVRELVRSSVRISEEEAFATYQRARSKATVRTVTAPSLWFARYVNKLDANQMEDFAVEHKAEVDTQVAQEKDRWTPGCSVVSEIRVDVDPAASDDEKLERRKKIDQARTRITRGEDFSLVAREISDGLEAAFGGGIGCLGDHHGPGVQALQKAAGELKPGEISPVIESVRGLHILRIDETLAEDRVEAAARQHVIRRLATEASAKDSAARFARELITRASGESLEAAMESLALAYAESGPLGKGKDGQHPALQSDLKPKLEISRAFTIDQNPLPTARASSVAQVAFGLEKDDALAEEPIETSDGYAVLQLKSKEMVDRETFNEEKAELMEQLRARKAEETLANYVARLRKEAGTVLFNPRHVPADGDKPEEEG